MHINSDLYYIPKGVERMQLSGNEQSGSVKIKSFVKYTMVALYLQD